jgi:5-formyltetrahydrofolate cyclo-ligase
MEIDAAVEEVLRRRAKAVLRQRARALRGTIPRAALAERIARILAGLARLPALHALDLVIGPTAPPVDPGAAVASRAEAGPPLAVALFYPIEGRNEVDLRPLDVALRQRGARVAYPSIDPDSRVMTFRFVSNIESMDERGLGFREPADSDEEASHLDIIVVPALQIDPRGHRIGYGAGFYDRALPRFAPPALKVGVAYDFQLISEVPVTEGDVALDRVVTDTRTIEVEPGA